MAYTRKGGRAPDAMRIVQAQTGYVSNPRGSCLMSFGDTKVLCCASVSQESPAWMARDPLGWITAEYSMLPSATLPRAKRERKDVSGRTKEIQRLIGRSLRNALDRRRIQGLTVTLDCDVIHADGGTRTASVTGAYVALALAARRMMEEGIVAEDPLRQQVAAVSVGISHGQPMLDLDYEEDSRAEVDMNIVGTSDGTMLEVQGTGEGRGFTKAEMDAMMELAWKGLRELFVLQQKVIRDAPARKL